MLDIGCHVTGNHPSAEALIINMVTKVLRYIFEVFKGSCNARDEIVFPWVAREQDPLVALVLPDCIPVFRADVDAKYKFSEHKADQRRCSKQNQPVTHLIGFFEAYSLWS